MKPTFNVREQSEIYIGPTADILSGVLPEGRVIVVSDATIDRLYHPLLAPYDTVLIGAGESIKTLQTVESIYRRFIELGADRSTFVLAVGGGIAADAVCVADIGAKDIPAQVAFAKSHDIDFAVVAPDDPLVLGAVDALEAAGIPCFGPEAKAAIIEGSKVFSKDLMKKYGIPTAEYQVFTDAGAAMDYVRTCPLPVVVKADGLALGKGVLIAEDRAAAIAAVETIMLDHAFGSSGNQVVIEEFLTGPEVSVLAFTDGKTVVPMVSSMDHKRAHDHDEGLNTGGMGTVAPNPYYTDDIARIIIQIDRLVAVGKLLEPDLHRGF